MSGSDNVRIYEINAVDDTGAVVVISTTDRATVALTKFREALSNYRRAWASDETGNDMSHEDLMVRAAQEQSFGLQ